MRVIGIIPARGGSKGIPRKNLRLLHGRPLLAYTADAALAAKSLSKVILSTEDLEIADIGRQLGLEVPFARPPELAQDDTPTLPVIQHAVRELETEGERYDAICLLQPTNPLRTAEDIDGCIELFERSGTDCVISVLPVPHEHNPYWVYFETDEGYLRLSMGGGSPLPRRQLLPPAFHRDGSVYVTARHCLDRDSLYGDKIAGYRMPAERSVNLDTPADWADAERRIALLG